MKSMKMAMAGMLVALTAVGAVIKIPAIIGSVALEAFPALLAAVLLGGTGGAIVASIGHLISAMVGGMPLGPLHFLIAGEMALLSFVFGFLYLRGKRWQAGVLFVFGNAFAAPMPFIFLMGKAFYMAIVPSLFIGSILNIVIAYTLIPKLSRLIEPLTKAEAEQ
ncbi:ECF transporter S component [Bacillus sp. ISL-47]|uniref:ECF transporter S component n=1 Tax=Bacillus sp. ISL-47 TaxID=2819130 RepID=UPI001BEB0868|nr:ECF transporter S component [Bacillus sp. ISL-47]MBT2689181.1 ECF transporter S component [Bacillus sp. ISL-47]MBT2710289.1 ECF transporter S component [Pseudomonas sp. ISL-84]